MELEVVDYLIIAGVFVLIVYAAVSISEKREVAKPHMELKIEVSNITEVNITTPKNVTFTQAKSFDFRSLKLNKTDFEDAFANEILHDAFGVNTTGPQTNVLLAITTTKGKEYYTIRLRRGSFIGLEERLFGNTITRIDTDVDSWRGFIEAAKGDDRKAMHSLLVERVRISDSDIRIRLQNTIEDF
ncbi:hypothetical protein HY641_02765 [Candidatus Woesearchaeota archaeon]|nr:hypothetical protein [Candidatus Woesearchaeota archaeon]